MDTQYGPVQVQLRIRGHRIISAAAVAYPRGTDRDLNQQVRQPGAGEGDSAAQSARMDTVSGASYTSDGYARSLQSALDAASR